MANQIKVPGVTLKKRKTSSCAPTLENEVSLGYPSRTMAGVDEVGRGCLAGAVYAAAIVLPQVISYDRDPWLREIRDSKLLTPDVRERLAPLIENWAAAFGVGRVDAREIDRLNIYFASHHAMRLAVRLLSPLPAYVLVDGNRVPSELGVPATAIIKGDLKCLSIAAASILAKVARDREMIELDRTYPHFQFAVHKGYPTPMHLAALREFGPTVEHRQSFGPVKAALARVQAGPPVT